MPKIHVLEDTLADQIAAGEVVERPASVVKELLENALDAGARNVRIDIRGGGVELIQVTDDGCGMDRADAALCLRRHATSKIRSLADLATIASLGFRGEALPSIASVSRLRLVTRLADAVEGTEVLVEGGAAPRISPAGCAPGTMVEVRELFYNVPARRKFLKATATESAHIGEVCLRVALTQPGLRLTLSRDGKRAKEYLPAADWRERAQLVVLGKSVQIEGSHGAVQVRALLSPPEDARSGAVALYTYVNGRPVRDRSLARSVAFAYGSVLPAGRYPAGVVHLALEPEEVDVNVHPQKAEVRFQRGREVYEAITRILARSLGTSPWRGPAARSTSYWDARLPAGPVAGEQRAVPEPPIPQAARESQLPMPIPSAPQARPDDRGPQRPGAESSRPAPGYGPSPAAAGELRDGPLAASAYARREVSAPFPSGLRALAQSRRLYIIAEGERGLCVVDQHAADERIQYDRLRREFDARKVRQQQLLIPVRVELSERETALIEQRGAEIAEAGIEVRLIGATSAAVHAIPAMLGRAAPERLLRDWLDEISRAGERNFGDAVDTALATMACHGAIRAGDALSLPECQALLDHLATIDGFGGHCPHGRPVVFEIGFDELARKVGR